MVWKNANKSFTFAWKTRLWMQQRQPYSSLQIQQRKKPNNLNIVKLVLDPFYICSKSYNI